MAIDRERHIGVTSEPRLVEVEKGFLKLFAQVTGETDPVYFDEQAAQAAGHPGLPMPPTYLFSLALSAPADRGNVFDKTNGIGVEMASVLHGEQSFTYYKPIHAGDELLLTTKTTDIYAKKGGALEFIVQDTFAVDSTGELIAEMRTVTVVRNA